MKNTISKISKIEKKAIKDKKIDLLKDYFLKRRDVLMVFVFGSFASGRQMRESDFDVAVYFDPKKLPKKDSERFDLEGEIWSDVSDIVEEEVDLTPLNEAPASLISNVIKTGIPLVIKDKKLYWEVYLKNSSEAEEFLEFAESFWKIKQRAKSLGTEDKEKLMARFDFLKTQAKELERFQNLIWNEYLNDVDKRRIVERWTENIINALIDISKIILASEDKLMPRSYEEALQGFGFLAGFEENDAQKFKKFAELRNILAHEYLDILYKRIKNFVKEFPPLYQKVVKFLEKYLKEN